MSWEVVIGLETHAQLSTASKIFSGASTAFGAAPNTQASAVDLALWDLKARLLDQPLVAVLDAAHEGVPIYGSGGFCSYSDARLREQLGGWAAVQKKHFSDGGLFDQIYRPGN